MIIFSKFARQMHAFKKYLAALLLILCGFAAFGQGRVYTRKAKLEDFPMKTTRIVLTGQTVFDAIIKEEFSSRWMVTPSEFCTVQEYLADKLGNMYYFVRMAFDNDFTYMVLSKAGDPDAEDQLKRGFDVVMIPIAPAVMEGGDEYVYLPAYIDIMQEYISRALESEKVAYRGLKAICSKPIGPILSDREEAIPAFIEGRAFTNVKITIPSSSNPRRSCELIISTDTHELKGYKRK